MDRQQRAAMGRRIREARKAKGLLQKDAAALADVPARTYRSIENGETTAQADNLTKIMVALEIPALPDADEPPIWLELHHGDIPHELELYALIALQEWTRHLNDLLDMSECERMAEIRRRVRDWEVDVQTPTPQEIPLTPRERDDTPGRTPPQGAKRR